MRQYIFTLGSNHGPYETPSGQTWTHRGMLQVVAPDLEAANALVQHLYGVAWSHVYPVNEIKDDWVLYWHTGVVDTLHVQPDLSWDVYHQLLIGMLPQQGLVVLEMSPQWPSKVRTHDGVLLSDGHMLARYWYGEQPPIGAHIVTVALRQRLARSGPVTAGSLGSLPFVTEHVRLHQIYRSLDLPPVPAPLDTPIP